MGAGLLVFSAATETLPMQAQDRSLTPPVTPVATTTPWDQWGPRAGDREITLGGNAGSSKHFNNSFGGANATFGVFVDNSWEFILRQGVNYASTAAGRRAWNGSTIAAVDYHYTRLGRVVPFAGANIGGVYGASVKDSWAAGLEVGGKFYVQPKTFIFVAVEYSWLFQNAKDINHQFSDGQYRGSLGIGFNF